MRITPTPAPPTPPRPPAPTPTPDEPTAIAAASTPEPPDRIAGVVRVLAGTPLESYAAAMVAAADAAGIDWRLLPAIAVLESSGGRNACGGNAWGYASCRVTFGSFDEGIRIVAATLAAPPYAGFDVQSRLCVWVAGTLCSSAHAVEYRDQALGLFARMVAP